MIKLISDERKLYDLVSVLPECHYRDRIMFLEKCYGTHTHFCEFYESGECVICIFEKSEAIISGTPENLCEAGIFLSGLEKIDSDYTVCEKLLTAMDGFESLNVNFWEAQIVSEKTDKLNESPNLEEAFKIVSSGFGNLDFGLWYTDTSHKIRHGLSKCFVYDNSASVCANFFDGGIFLSQVSTLASKRHQGYATAMLHEVKGLYKNERVYLIAEENRNPFYQSAGFVMTGKAGRLIRKPQTKERSKC